MMYAITIYGEAGLFEQLPQSRQDEVMAGHRSLQERLGARGDYISVKLMPPSTAVTISPASAPDATPLIVDGPFAETKESFLGFYAAEFRDLDEALDYARMISSPIARLEVRPISWAGGVISTEG
ncbi:YciI family protein [Roseobacter sinensis]|uniref:YciI family protein n=1 Tax=Roseobacter sinensis TaxID=2931391 RepID=A0ABT3BC78_9RHOB|nr:YciI family protein [Roseobacter sp. WL0113]MCV3270728.1 YciI family protein [Roseobacter sp. WL0113]